VACVGSGFIDAIGVGVVGDGCYQNVNWESREKFYFAVGLNGV